MWGGGLSHSNKTLVLVVATSQVRFLVLPGGPLPPVPTRCEPLAGDTLANATAMPADLLGSCSLTPVNSYPPASEDIQLPHCSSDLLCLPLLCLSPLPLQICCSVVFGVAVQVRNDKLAICGVLGQTDKLGSYKPACLEMFVGSST